MKNNTNNMNNRIGIFTSKYITIFVILFSSCLPDPLEVDDVPRLQPQIVVTAQIIPDRYILIFLSKSIGALEASDDSDITDLLSQIIVNDATVCIFGNFGIDTLNFLGFGLYGSTKTNFISGQKYYLKVKSASLGEINAETEVKEQVLFKSVETKLLYNGYDTVAEINYSFKDLLGKNWYMLNAQRLSFDNLAETLLNPWATTILFTDDGFDDKIIESSFKLISRNFSSGDTILVSLSNISEEYYKFMEIRRDNRFRYTNFLGEPVNYPTNISGGYGFFNLYIPDIRFFIPKM